MVKLAWRVVQNLLCSGLHLHRHFPQAPIDRIEHAIAASEVEHRGEIRFAVETALDIGPLLRGQTARNRAIDVFARLRVWDTEQNNGVLIYLLLAERDIEIVADRGIADKVPPHEWEAIRRAMSNTCAKKSSAVGHPGRYRSGQRLVDPAFSVHWRGSQRTA
ncbi:MAG: TPM domain-containing protein [Gammaproteobacteria bacterium]